MRSAEFGRRLGRATAAMFQAIGDKTGGAYLRECRGVYADAQQAAEAKGADGVGGVVAGLKAVLTKVKEDYGHLQKDQPSLFEELRAMFRAGREDLLNTLNGLTLTREPGAPGNPTPQMATAGLMGLDLKKQNDVVSLTPANDQHQQQSRDGRDGRD